MSPLRLGGMRPLRTTQAAPQAVATINKLIA